MFSVLRFDEINSLLPKKRGVPFDIYFGEMGLTAEKRKKRIELAELLYDELWAVFVLMFLMEQTGRVDYDEIAVEVYEAYVRAGNAVDIPEGTLIERASEYAQNFVEATQAHEEDPYYFSEDRLVVNAENEANGLYNTYDYDDAVEHGLTHKTWRTMEDEKVRETHAEIDGITLPIDSLFEVGDSLMAYPKDTTYDASAEETVNCRCWCEYTR